MDNIILSKASVEIIAILEYFSEDLMRKIPSEFIKKLKERASRTYEFKYDKNKELQEQNIMKETKCILLYIYKEYICNDEQRSELNKYRRKILFEKEKEKKQKYDYSKDMFFNKKISNN